MVLCRTFLLLGVLAILSDRVDIKKDVPKGPPIPPAPKNLLNNSSGDISSSNIGLLPPGDLANPLKGDDADVDPGLNLLSGSPPNRSYLSFFSESDNIWNALETT